MRLQRNFSNAYNQLVAAFRPVGKPQAAAAPTQNVNNAMTLDSNRTAQQQQPQAAAGRVHMWAPSTTQAAGHFVQPTPAFPLGRQAQAGQQEEQQTFSPASPVFAFDDEDEFANPESNVAQQRAYRTFKCLSAADITSLLPQHGPVAQVQTIVSGFMRGLGRESTVDVHVLASLLHRNNLAPRVVTPSSAVSPSCRAGRRSSSVVSFGKVNPYLIIPAFSDDREADEDVIVDPSLKSWLTVGCEITSDYERKLATVPRIFVGTRQQLRSRVTEVAAAIALGFAAQNIGVPYWRSKKVLLQRWEQEQTAVSRKFTAELSLEEQDLLDSPRDSRVEEDDSNHIAGALQIQRDICKGQGMRSRRASDASSEVSDDLIVSPVSVLARDRSLQATATLKNSQVAAAGCVPKQEAVNMQPVKRIVGFQL